MTENKGVTKVAGERILDFETYRLVKEAMESNVTKEQFREFLERKKAERKNGKQAQ